MPDPQSPQSSSPLPPVSVPPGVASAQSMEVPTSTVHVSGQPPAHDSPFASPQPHTLETPDSTPLANIPVPSYDERKQPGFFFTILGIGPFRADKKLLQDAVSDVWRARPEWATTKATWTELPSTERSLAEDDLQKRLEELYPLSSHTGRQVRACREWLPKFLLADRHTQKKSYSRRRH